MYEVELKARVGDIGKMERKLIRLGAKLESEFEDIDTYYGMKWEVQPVSTLKKKDGRIGILLRIRERIKGGEITKMFTMRTLPSDDSSVREKMSIEIGDSDKMDEILDAMRVLKVLTLHKRRKNFVLDDKEILLDDIKELGTWMEVAREGVPKGQFRKAKEKLERFMKRELGIDEIEYREYFRIAVEEML